MTKHHGDCYGNIDAYTDDRSDVKAYGIIPKLIVLMSRRLNFEPVAQRDINGLVNDADVYIFMTRLKITNDDWIHQTSIFMEIEDIAGTVCQLKDFHASFSSVFFLSDFSNLHY